MIYPTIHLNGTSKASLLEQLSNTYAAIGDALGVLSDAAPNSRDYYPQGPHAFAIAAEEHLARLQALANVQAELLQLAEHLDAEAA